MQPAEQALARPGPDPQDVHAALTGHPDPHPAKHRFHHLDAVRAFALLLGVFFHAAESFGRGNHYWAIVDCSPSDLLELLRFAAHSFRMELFFVIAGFFARLLLLRRGAAGFVRNRISRILVPFVTGWILLYPILVLIWLWGARVSGTLATMAPPEALNLPLWQLWLGFFMTGGFLQRFDLTHLWFLHQLLVLYASWLIVAWFAARVRSAGAWMNGLDRLFTRLTAGRAAVFAVAFPAVPILLLMRDWGVDTPKESLLPYLPTTLLFGYCFLLGWLWHRQCGLLDGLSARWPGHFLLAAILVLGLIAFKVANITRHVPPAGYFVMRLGYTVAYALMMWAFVLGFLGLFTRFCSRPNPWTRYIADASYWIYIAHLPLVVALQVLGGRVPLPWPIKYPAICLIAVVLLFTSYHYLVRGTFIGAQLNGCRYPVRWPWQTHHPTDVGAQSAKC